MVQDHPIHKAVASFTTDAESIRTCSSIGSLMLLMVRTLVGNKYKDFINTCEKVDGSGNSYKVPLEQLSKHNKLESEFNRGQRATQIVPRSLLIALVSQYDAFLSSLIRALFALKPALVSASQRTIEFEELLNFKSIEEAKEFVIDGELEALLRDSHHQQFEWLEKRFGIETLRAFPAWSKFVELTQRRNLFVHTDGRVSKQYLRVCSTNGFDTGNLKPGDQLEADSSYVRQSVDIVFEVAVKLAQVLWRKALPDQIDKADQSLIEISYSLLERKRYSLAIVLLDFSFETLKRHSSPDYRLRMLINRANAYRLSGDVVRCKALVEAEDWSAYDPSFRMAAHILKGEVPQALLCMRQVGKDGSIKKTYYREWPIFEGIRDDPSFASTFEEIFGESFVTENVVRAQDGKADEPVDSFSLDTFSEQDFDLSKSRFDISKKLS